MASTAELFREYQHCGLRRTWATPPTTDGPSIMLPKTCEVLNQENIIVDRPLADCGGSKVLLVKLRVKDSNAARLLTLDLRVYMRCSRAKAIRQCAML